MALRIRDGLVAIIFLAGCGGSSKDQHGGTGGTGGSGGSTGGTGATGGKGGSAGSGNRAGSSDTSGATSGSGGDEAIAGRSGAGHGGGAGIGGTAGSGAVAGHAGNAGADNQPGGEGGGAGSGACATVTTMQKHAQHARSAGFSGTEAQYYELYNVTCSMTPECQTACMDRGGTTEMCGDTLCETSSGECLPTPIWTGLNSLAAEGSDPISDAAEIVLWSYPYHDPLLLDQFKLEVPADAEVLGITATVRRAAGGDDEAVDAGVHLIKHGVVGSTDRSSPTPWSAPDFVNVDYGGPADLWGETWTAADLNADDFGVSLTVGYPQTAGSGRGYVDIVYVTVTYRTCE